MPLHPEFVAIQMRESTEPRFRSIVSAPPDIQPNGLSAASKLMATFRLFAKPLQTSLAESGWLWQQLPAEGTNFLRDTRLDLVLPIAIAPDGREALIVLGPKKSEEPYSGEDRQLLSPILVARWRCSSSVLPELRSAAFEIGLIKLKLEHLMGTGLVQSSARHAMRQGSAPCYARAANGFITAALIPDGTQAVYPASTTKSVPVM